MTMKATTIAVTAILLLGGLYLYMNRYEYLPLGEIRVHNGLTVGFNVAVSVPSCLEWGSLGVLRRVATAAEPRLVRALDRTLFAALASVFSPWPQ